MTFKVLHIGAGGFGERWCDTFLPPNVADGTIEVVGLVDIAAKALETGRKHLGLKAEQCFTSAAQAFQTVDADFCTIVIPPALHEGIVDLALARGMHILSEKPIADTMEASIRIAGKVKAAGRKMAVTMSHRFDQDKSTLRSLVRGEALGRINTVSCRFAGDFRLYDSWGRFRHEMVHPMLIEGAVHHLDIMADLAGAPCTSIFARSWKPEWAEYKGDTDVIVMMDFENGAHGVYEASCTQATGLNDWSSEYFRVEAASGTAILDHREVEVFHRHPPERGRQTSRQGQGQQMPLLTGRKWQNTLLIEEFCQWLDGGPAMTTNVDDNLQSVALVFSAIESARLGQPVKVQEYLQSFRNSASIAAR
ncbi:MULTISPECIES: Gfo/Idh/MocA family protein [Sinorhizobium]|uniref:Gfo/Idh/MocA family protein n=1 Tax=Sinorhizobium TaxID=28105 RepID=UPI0004BB9AE7|nr:MULTISPECIES: Gfo/Idh/MocA family oxidoreductase [Sinorhizobium]ASY60623.1 glucose-fructose oxidoreductase related protein [Sinorhizobium sp. CCBAU 05631]ASY74203.1 glucose-fructose oxidoreductase related protein [Sinorhizobium fredii CCBAU 83666]